MSKRGVALGGKYPGIYKKTMADGSIRYAILFTESSAGKRKYKWTTLPYGMQLTEAVSERNRMMAKRTLGQLTFYSEKPTLGFVIEQLNAIKKAKKSYTECVRYLKEIANFFGSSPVPLHELDNTRIERFFSESRPVDSIDDVRVAKYRAFLAKQPLRGRRKGILSNQSKDHRLNTLRNLFNYAHKKGFITYVPEITFFRNYGVREINLDLESFIRIYESMPPSPMPHRAILLVALFTGQRRADVLRMKVSQIASGYLTFQSSKTGKRDFRIPIPDALKRELDQLKPFKTPFLFPNPQTQKPYRDLRSPLRTACRRNNLPNITFHQIRHLTADLMAQISGKEMAVKEYIGWSSIQMVRRYTHLENWTTQYVADLGHRVTDALGAKTAPMSNLA